MKRQCAICENEFEEYEMMQISPSPAHPKWLCWECWKNSQYEANKSDHARQKKLYQIHKSKKRHT